PTHISITQVTQNTHLIKPTHFLENPNVMNISPFKNKQWTQEKSEQRQLIPTESSKQPFSQTLTHTEIDSSLHPVDISPYQPLGDLEENNTRKANEMTAPRWISKPPHRSIHTPPHPTI